MEKGETMRFLVIDTETTGQDPNVDKVCELGFCVSTLDETLLESCTGVLVDPGVPISPEASAVHHIIDEDVSGKPHLGGVLASFRDWGVWRACDAYVAHNAPFDKGFLPQLTDKPWIDTLRMARRYYPDFPSHGNQALRYRLKLPVPRDLDVHRAHHDSIVTAALLRHTIAGPAAEDFNRLGVADFAAYLDTPIVLAKIGFGQHRGEAWADAPWSFLRWAAENVDDIDAAHTAKHWLANYQPKLLETVAFGKHKGQLWSAVPDDYLGWLLRQPDTDPDVSHTARRYLRR